MIVLMIMFMIIFVNIFMIFLMIRIGAGGAERGATIAPHACVVFVCNSNFLFVIYVVFCNIIVSI
jgi:hypothetical protein